jgi:hypothetical protein
MDEVYDSFSVKIIMSITLNDTCTHQSMMLMLIRDESKQDIA